MSYEYPSLIKIKIIFFLNFKLSLPHNNTKTFSKKNKKKIKNLKILKNKKFLVPLQKNFILCGKI
jgi:hypothetical protein